MEQNKVLMVIVSVAIFFAAIVGVGVALLYPRGDAGEDASLVTAGRSFDPIEYVRSPDDSRLEETESEREPTIIVYGEAETDQEADDADGMISVKPGDGDTADTSQESATGDSTGESGIPAPEADDGRTIVREPARTSRTATSDDGASRTERSTQPQSPAQPQPRVAESAPRQIRVTEYWIQLIASPSRDRVESVQETLADYSLGGRVTTRDIDGELYYRLRVGPYENQQEAEKFLSWIRDIDGFEGAYISEEYPLRTVNG